MSWETTKSLLTIISEIGGVIALAGFGVSAVRHVVAALRKQKKDFDDFLDSLSDSTATVAERSDLGMYMMNMINGLTSLRDLSLFYSLMYLVFGLIYLFAIVHTATGNADLIASFCVVFSFVHLTSATLTERRARKVRIRFDQLWTDILIKHKARRKSE